MLGIHSPHTVVYLSDGETQGSNSGRINQESSKSYPNCFVIVAEVMFLLQCCIEIGSEISVVKCL